MKKTNIEFFNYASVDFLIDKNGIPVFMEVNDNTLAPYFIEQKKLITEAALSGSEQLINLNLGHKKAFLACFDKCFETVKRLGNGERTIAIVCKRRELPDAIEKEMRYLVQLFQENGYAAEIYIPEDLELRHGQLFVKRDESCPSVIFRRNFSFPSSGIVQPVINDVLVRKIAGDKYWTHKIVEELLQSGEMDIRQPKTYLIKDRQSLVSAIESFFHIGSDCIAKPNKSYGGDGFYYFKNHEVSGQIETQKKLEAIVKRMEKGEEYLIQEKIESSLFKSANNQEYYFDVRVMVYGGKFAGIEGRRSDYPFNKEEVNENSLVTNINSGGIDILVIGTMDKQCRYETRVLAIPDKVDKANFDVDSSFLILGDELLSKLKQSAEAIVQSIDNVLLKSKENTYE